LQPGARLGPYEILAPIGAGGMGEVYRARDTRLGRDVAVKILSPDTSSSPEARQRFEREARTISQLSHPHICALYDVGEAANPQFPIPNPYLVMELLDGETLAQRLASAALPLELTLRYAIQIADALEKAHRAGIVHRDLKPANVMVTKAGVKLLDFGLAKAVGPPGPGSANGETMAAASPITARGAIAGTVQYMAPEQIDGRPADARTDLYAFGAVIYEMATGTRAFASALRPLTPEALDRIVVGCLAADPDERWQSAHDVRLQLRAIADSSPPSAVAPSAIASARPGPGRWIPWALAALTATAAIVAVAMRPAQLSHPAAIVKFSVPPPVGGGFYENYENTGIAVSPDGLRIAFSARGDGEPQHLWIRSVSDLDARSVAGTEGATSLFWSPDGGSVAFFTSTKLRRIDLSGGAAVSICDVSDGIGYAGTWGADGQILFSSIEGQTIFRVPAGGGAQVPFASPDPARQEVRFNWPYFLPDGRRYLYLARLRDGSGHLMIAGPGQPVHEVRPMQSSAQYADPGYLVFASEGAIVGQRFDLSRGEIVGTPFSVAEAVGYFFTTTVGRFAVSKSGTLVYQSHSDEHHLAAVDRSGREEGTLGEAGRYQLPRISPDGRRVAYARQRAGAFDVWQMDLERHVETRLTMAPSSEQPGPWSPDGASLFYSADVGAPPKIFRKTLATGTDEPMLPGSGTFQHPEDVSPDGKTLLFMQRAPGGNDIWSLALDGSSKATPIVVSPSEEIGARFSPDGRFFTFDSNASGQRQVYITPFPLVGERTPVSRGAGSSARWRRDGKALFYLSPDSRLMMVPIETTPSLRIGTPVALFDIDKKRPWLDFDVSPTGQFVAVVLESRASGQPLTVVVNGLAEFARQ
jgi:Tol biopolymer transport system component